MNGKIYIVKNTVNEKVYIGQTIQKVEDRFKQHLKLLKSNSNQIIGKAIKSLGGENFYFEILAEDIDTYEKLNELEEYYIKMYNCLTPSGYNSCPGGQKWRRKGAISECDYQDIAEKYNAGSSLREISNYYNCGHATIIGILDKLNINRRDKTINLPDKTSKITKEMMEELYLNKKMTIKEIACLLNVNEKTVRRAKKRFCIVK